MTPGPGLRKWTEYLSPGPGGMPLALRLSDWLGLTFACTAPHDFAPLLAHRLDFPLRAADSGVAGLQAAVPQQLQKRPMPASAAQ
jgi:hypothetical protein